MNLDDMLKNEMLMFGVYKGDIDLSLFIFFLAPVCCLTCLLHVSGDRLLVGKIIHK